MYRDLLSCIVSQRYLLFLRDLIDAVSASGGNKILYTKYCITNINIDLLTNAPVSLGCKKLATVTMFSTKTEYMTLSSACQEAGDLHRLIGITSVRQ